MWVAHPKGNALNASFNALGGPDENVYLQDKDGMVWRKECLPVDPSGAKVVRFVNVVNTAQTWTVREGEISRRLDDGTLRRVIAAV